MPSRVSQSSSGFNVISRRWLGAPRRLVLGGWVSQTRAGRSAPHPRADDRALGPRARRRASAVSVGHRRRSFSARIFDRFGRRRDGDSCALRGPNAQLPARRYVVGWACAERAATRAIRRFAPKLQKNPRPIRAHGCHRSLRNVARGLFHGDWRRELQDIPEPASRAAISRSLSGLALVPIPVARSFSARATSSMISVSEASSVPSHSFNLASRTHWGIYVRLSRSASGT